MLPVLLAPPPAGVMTKVVGTEGVAFALTHGLPRLRNAYASLPTSMY